MHQNSDQEAEDHEKQKRRILYIIGIFIGGVAILTDQFLPLQFTKQQIGIFQVDPFILIIAFVWCGFITIYLYMPDSKKPS